MINKKPTPEALLNTLSIVAGPGGSVRVTQETLEVCSQAFSELRAEVERLKMDHDHLQCSHAVGGIYKHAMTCSYPNEDKSRTQLVAEVERLKALVIHLNAGREIQQGDENDKLLDEIYE